MGAQRMMTDDEMKEIESYLRWMAFLDMSRKAFNAGSWFVFTIFLYALMQWAMR